MGAAHQGGKTMKTQSQRLLLNRETIRVLTDASLYNVAAGVRPEPTPPVYRFTYTQFLLGSCSTCQIDQSC
jgi:hypothetical protein